MHENFKYSIITIALLIHANSHTFLDPLPNLSALMHLCGGIIELGVGGNGIRDIKSFSTQSITGQAEIIAALALGSDALLRIASYVPSIEKKMHLQKIMRVYPILQKWVGIWCIFTGGSDKGKLIGGFILLFDGIFRTSENQSSAKKIQIT